MTITAEYSPIKEKDTRKLLSETKFFEGYSRFSKDLNRYETWGEAVGRVMDMHRGFFADKIAANPKLGEYIDQAEEAYKEKLILGAQRSLQYGGEQILKHHMRMYNCLKNDTKFVTDQGIRSFLDFSDGDIVRVITHTGKWQNATVKSYGQQKLYDIVLTKGSGEKTITATKDHRWYLHDGSETSNLQIGDRLLKEPQIFSEFDWDESDPLEQLYWCYGYVYGDGTVNGNHSMVRLCKKDIGLEERFLRMGFKSSSSASLEGDVMIYTGTYLKTLPDPKKDSPELIRAFVAGYLMADGERNYQKDGKQYGGIQASNKESIKFIREIFPVAGVHIISETDYTDQETNYGIRPYTIRFTTCDSSGSKYNSGWKVKSITPAAIETVWCLEVENDHSFILDGGIVTGNCTSSYADRPAFFGEYFYILLCGCGAGFSVQKHHIAKLPMIRPRTKQPKTHTITDDIEGWATALDVLLSSFFIGGGKYPEYEGRRVFFEYHKIRDKNSPISGGFKAPGPEPLKKALNKIEELLNRIAENGILRAIDIYDILMHAADAVISGGVRRAATICLFSKDDTEMLSAKTGNWFEENPQRARSNNSVVFKRNEVTLEEFLSIMKYVREFGEPGFVFVSSLEHCFNPCVSADTWIDTENGLKQVKSLINNPFTAIVDGKPYPSKGFWKTGTKELFEISTNRGYTLKVTDNHKILIEKNKERLWIEVKYLNIGDNIVMNDNMDTHFHINLEEKEKGWLLGEVIGDGCHNPEKYDSLVRFWGKSAKQMANKSAEIFSKYFPSRYEGRNAKPQYNKINDSYMVSNRAFTEFCSFYLEPETKNLLENAIENMSPSFISGLISGLFDSDGHVSFSSNKNSRSIRLTQNNLPRLKMIQILLSKLGIPSTIYEDRHPEKSWENYESTPIHEIHISRNGIDRFHEIIGFSEPNKQRILEEMQSSKKRQTYRDKFVSKITAIKKIGTEDVYDCTIEDIHCFSANGLIVHNCVEIGMLPVTEDGKSGWQGCVSENTKLITRNGSVRISDVVGEKIDIWNGQKWATVEPIITGENRTFYKITFGDGSELEVTENHKFLIKNRFEKDYREVTTLELIDALSTEKYTLSLPRYDIIRDETNKIDIKSAYDYGFIFGDGNVRQHKNSATAIVYEKYFDCNFPIGGNLQSETVDTYNNQKVRTYYWNKNDIDLNLAYSLKYSEELPEILFTWNRKSLLEFFAGWIDTDGTILKNGGCRIYGQEGHVRSAQLLLTSMGIKSSVNRMSKAGDVTNFGIRNRDVWYLQITETEDLYSNKGKIVSGKLTKKGKEQTIRNIIKLNGLGTSYCFEEPETHCAVFNNVLTKQCNLVEGNGSKCVTKEDFFRLCRVGSILATLQAAYTNFKFVGENTKHIFEREALLGVSLTGWMNSPDVLFDEKVLQEGAKIVKETNREVAKMLGIRPAARTTCVKPAGNASVLLGTASGIHPEHSKRYLRNIQINKSQEVSDIIKKFNPYMVEESVWSNLKTDNIISFPIISPKNSIFKADLTGVEFLEKVKLVQNNWIEYGTDESLCVDPTVRHNVSNTVVVKDDEWDIIGQYIYDNRNYFTGISLIGETGDKDYFQAPNIEVLTPREMVRKYGEASLFASGLITDASNGFNNLWEATRIAIDNHDESSQELKDIRSDWIRRFRKFADNFFNGDLKKTEYCLKDVYILYKWMKIQINLKDINLEEHLKIAKSIDIDTMAAQACAGGACEI